jgi:hypothetical protein
VKEVVHLSLLVVGDQVEDVAVVVGKVLTDLGQI